MADIRTDKLCLDENTKNSQSQIGYEVVRCDITLSVTSRHTVH